LKSNAGRPPSTISPFEERLGILVDREAAERDSKKLASRLKFAALRQDASVEDLDLRTPRGLDRSVMAHLADGGWIARHENLLITGPTGLGKSWIACAIDAVDGSSAGIAMCHVAVFLRNRKEGAAHGEYQHDRPRHREIGVPGPCHQ
jgi:hypothetical protein